MKVSCFFLSAMCALGCCIGVAAQPLPSATHDRMEWFADAKLGIFIHWGIYAVHGIDESWSFYNRYISHADYMKQTKGFSAQNYQPQAWASLIKKSGAKYTVITSKHHDGFALWDSKDQVLNAVKHSAAKRDVLTPFVKSAREAGLKVGIYYSLIDWSYPDYTDSIRDQKRYNIADAPKRWEKFLNYYQAQLSDLSDRYHPDLFWFDGNWEHSNEEWQAEKVKKMLLDKTPKTIINSRLDGKGDYATPEQGVPIRKPKSPYWELCMTMNNSWGYQGNDHHYKTPERIIGIFTDVISHGGNLLLDIGPKADGTIAEEQRNILETLGAWTSKNAEAIYGSVAGIPKDYFYGPSTLSKDKKTLYLFVKGSPKGEVVLRGIENKIQRIRIVGQGEKLDYNTQGKVYWSNYPGITYIALPDTLLDKYMTVIAVSLDREIKLHEAESKAIESN